MKHNAALTAIALAAYALPTTAADWPMWRCDVNRTAASPEQLPAKLHLRWTRQLPPYAMAWPNESRLHFDRSYEPIVSGKTLFLGFANDGSVRAFDTETGDQRWRFYTEGPVRLAPVAANGKVYVGSDDGWLYCLNAADGALLWKVRGAPEDRSDYRHLGNNRLVSFWPVRGGPVVADGVAYFAAGIWPTHGVFVLAVDAESGEVHWVNDDSNYLSEVRLDHNELHEAGLSPQGHLLISGDMLLVPNGRSFPARIDRATGKLLYYVQGYRHGDCRVSTMGKFAFVGRSGVMNVADGREVGSRWVDAGENAPNKFDGAKFDLFEGPIDDYKFFPACDADSVLTPDTVYGMDKGSFFAYDLTHPEVTEREKEHAGRKLHPWKWDLPLRWKAPTRLAGGNPPSSVVIKAGNRLYGHAGNTLVSCELAADYKPPAAGWEYQLNETPTSMLAADGKLFVVTAEGGLHCFGAADGEAKKHPLPATAEAPNQPDNAFSEAVSQVLKTSGVTEGYCLLLGAPHAGYVHELVRQTKLSVQIVDRDRGTIDALRDDLTAAGLYGTRVEAFVGEPCDFAFPPYLASLVLMPKPDRAAFRPEAHTAALCQVLRPYGGTACLKLTAGETAAVNRARLQSIAVEQADGLTLLRRNGPLPGAAYWTHEGADAGRSYFSRDKLVNAPLGVLWYGDGPGYGFFKSKDYGVGVKPQVVGGRLFAYQIASRTLRALDVYTGRELWVRKVEHFTRYASMEDGIYVAGASKCHVLDPATGEPTKEFTYDVGEGVEPQVADIRVGDDVIVIASAPEKSRNIAKGLWDAKWLVALDRQSGKQLWVREAKERFNNHALALGGARLFCIDSLSPGANAAAERKGELPKETTATLLALNARTGDVQWTTVSTHAYRSYGDGNWLGLRGNDDWVAYSGEHDVLLAGRNNELRAFEAATGNALWQKQIGGGQPVIVGGDTFITQALHVYNLRTGEIVNDKIRFARGGCNYAVASERLIFVRDRSVSYIELDTADKHYLRNVRSGCSNSLVAADGLLNAPCFSVNCVCNYPIQTSFAMLHMPEVASWAGGDAVDMRARMP